MACSIDGSPIFPQKQYTHRRILFQITNGLQHNNIQSWNI